MAWAGGRQEPPQASARIRDLQPAELRERGVELSALGDPARQFLVVLPLTVAHDEDFDGAALPLLPAVESVAPLGERPGARERRPRQNGSERDGEEQDEDGPRKAHAGIAAPFIGVRLIIQARSKQRTSPQSLVRLEGRPGDTSPLGPRTRGAAPRSCCEAVAATPASRRRRCAGRCLVSRRL